MKAVLSMGWALVSFRSGPEALPYAPQRVLPLVLVNLLLSALIQMVSESEMARPVVQLSALALAAEALWLWLLLRRRDQLNRWVQSYSALVLIDTFITALAAPLSLLLLRGGEALVPVAAVVQVVMTLWSLSVRGFIYQNTMTVSRWRGVLMALAPLFITMLVSLPLFPELLPAPPAQGN